MLQLEIRYVGAWGAIGYQEFTALKNQDSWEEENSSAISSQLSKDELRGS